MEKLQLSLLCWWHFSVTSSGTTRLCEDKACWTGWNETHTLEWRTGDFTWSNPLFKFLSQAVSKTTGILKFYLAWFTSKKNQCSLYNCRSCLIKYIPFKLDFNENWVCLQFYIPRDQEGSPQTGSGLLHLKSFSFFLPQPTSFQYHSTS